LPSGKTGGVAFVIRRVRRTARICSDTGSDRVAEFIEGGSVPEIGRQPTGEVVVAAAQVLNERAR
jgi:hypothetical protein